MITRREFVQTAGTAASFLWLRPEATGKLSRMQVIGVDLAKPGEDRTVLGVFDAHGVLTHHIEKQGV